MIVDTPDNVVSVLPALKGGSVTDIVRYLNPLGPSAEKTIKPAEVRAIGAAGIKLALVCEGYGQPTHHDPLGGITAAAGTRDGKWCRDYAELTLKAPAGAAIYFALDWDTTTSNLLNLVQPYFQAIHPFFADGKYRVGVYGSGNACSYVTDTLQLAALAWLSGSTGWAGYASFKPRASLLQVRMDTKLFGIDCDTDIAQVADYGAFLPAL